MEVVCTGQKDKLKNFVFIFQELYKIWGNNTTQCSFSITLVTDV